MKYACVKNGVVDNIIVAEPEVLPDLASLGCDFVQVDDGVFVDIGWQYSNGVFSPIEA